MLRVVRFKILQSTAIIKRQFVKIPTACKLVGGKVWFDGASHQGDTITVLKADIDSNLKSYLIPGWTPEGFVSGTAQNGYTITVNSTVLLTKASGPATKTPLLMNYGAGAGLPNDYPELDAEEFLSVNLPITQDQAPATYFIDLEFEI